MLNNIETMRDRDQKYAENKTKSNMSVSNKEMRGPFIFSGESVDAWIYLMDMYFQENRMKRRHKIKVALYYCDSKVDWGINVSSLRGHGMYLLVNKEKICEKALHFGIL